MVCLMNVKTFFLLQSDSFDYVTPLLVKRSFWGTVIAWTQDQNLSLNKLLCKNCSIFINMQFQFSVVGWISVLSQASKEQLEFLFLFLTAATSHFHCYCSISYCFTVVQSYRMSCDLNDSMFVLFVSELNFLLKFSSLSTLPALHFCPITSPHLAQQ